jgi:hypothetical protein
MRCSSKSIFVFFAIININDNGLTTNLRENITINIAEYSPAVRHFSPKKNAKRFGANNVVIVIATIDAPPKARAIFMKIDLHSPLSHIAPTPRAGIPHQ